MPETTPPTAPGYQERITQRLTDALDPVSLRVVDESHRHASHGPRLAALAETGGAHGHAPIDGLGETHFRVEIVSAAFAGRSRLERHRMVNDLLAAELRERVHALTLKTRTPEEAAAAPTSGRPRG